MSEIITPKCPQCGAEMPSDPTGRVCPRCAAAFLGAAPTELPADAAGSPHPFTPPPVAELAPMFPQLELLELIGQGGMGAVYRARQKELDRIVALKILPPGIGDAAFADRFAREAKALARLNHPGIVTLFEFGRTDGLFFFLMEFVDGVNLRQVLHGGRISPREALAIVPAICDALQYAHDQGIVHRDIKPENILLDRRGRTKVADFGLAKLMKGTSEISDFEASTPAGSLAVTRATQVLGTPHYMAPEQGEQPAAVDHRADIYALGVVFYQMLTGELPGKHMEPPSKKVHIDVRLDEVVLRALEKNPNLRYTQASALKTDVETITRTEQLSTAAEHSTVRNLVRLLKAPVGEPGQRAAPIQIVEKVIVLPVRVMTIIILGYYFCFSSWLNTPAAAISSLQNAAIVKAQFRPMPEMIADWSLKNAVFLRRSFIAYASLSIIVSVTLIWARRPTLARIEWLAFASGVLDCGMLMLLTTLSSGFNSELYWVFAVIILHNALAIPAVFPQLLLNSLTIGSFVAGGMWDARFNSRPPVMDIENISQEKPFERILVLVTWALCCYGVQVLLEKQKPGNSNQDT